MNTTPNSPTRSPLAGPLWLIAIGLLLIAGFLGVSVFRSRPGESERREREAPERSDRIKTPVETSTPAAEFKQRLAAIESRRNAARAAAARPIDQRQPEAGPRSLAAPAPVVTAVPIPGAVPAHDATLEGVVAANTAGEIFGRVTLIGTPPPEKVIDMSADARCAEAHPEPITTRHYVLGPNGGLANVFVYIKTGLEDRTFPVPTDTPVLDQVGCEFQPYVIGVQVNQGLLIKNSDPTLHNLHFTPRINREFNLAEPSQGEVLKQSFSQPEVLIRVKCDVHPWMFAYVGVVAHPFLAVTGAEGTFRFPPGVPSGNYTIAAVHVKAGEATRRIAVPERRSTRVDFTLAVPQ